MCTYTHMHVHISLSALQDTVSARLTLSGTRPWNMATILWGSPGHPKRPCVGVLANRWAEISAYSNHQPQSSDKCEQAPDDSSHQPLNLPAEAPRHHDSESSCSCRALSERLTHITREHHTRLSPTAKFWGYLFCNPSNWNTKFFAQRRQNCYNCSPEYLAFNSCSVQPQWISEWTNEMKPSSLSLHSQIYFLFSVQWTSGPALAALHTPVLLSPGS